MAKRGRAGACGNKYKMSLGLPMSAVMNCADNSGAKNLYVVSVSRRGAALSKLPSCSPGDFFLGSCK